MRVQQANFHSPSTIPAQGKKSRVDFFLPVYGLLTETSTIKIERKKFSWSSAHLLHR